eukprot:966077-Prymnesium_polylepis.1
MPSGIRYVNAGKAWSAEQGRTIHFDFIISNHTAYTPANSSSNGLNGGFARISVASSTEVDLRLTVYESCATEDSCRSCEDSQLTGAEIEQCYDQGCSCFQDIVTEAWQCNATLQAWRRETYDCPQMNDPLILPTQALVSFSVYDFDGGPGGGCLEQVDTLTSYVYKVTPLVPSSRNEVPTK